MLVLTFEYINMHIPSASLNYNNTFQHAHNKEWGFHNARVNSVGWSTDSSMVASGSLDTTIIIWSVSNPAKHTIIKSTSILFFKQNFCQVEPS